MRRIVLLSGGLCGVLLVIIVGAMLIGTVQPASALIAKYHLTDCEQPCWMGIVPGKTSREDARDRVFAMLRSFPGYQFQDQTFRYDSMRYALRDAHHNGDTMIDVTCLTQDEIVNSCAIGWSPELGENRPTLLDLQSILGKPDRVAWTPGLIVQFYGDAYHGVALLALADWRTPLDRLQLDTRALGIVFYSSNKAVVGGNKFSPWRGFTIAARYIE